jgi:predicted AAA+ superfamily ATPase
MIVGDPPNRHASIRVSGPRKAGKTTSAALVDDVTAAAQEATQSTEREHHVDHTP